MPFAGILIDRSNRKTMMLVYDFLSLVALTVLLFQTLGPGSLALYVAAVFQDWLGISVPFLRCCHYLHGVQAAIHSSQWAHFAAVRNPGIFGPLLAGVLYLAIGLTGLAINLLAFVISIGVLLFVEIPEPQKTVEGQLSHTKFLSEALYGIKYILQRPNLLGLQLIFFTGNLFSGIALSAAVLYPMILFDGQRYPNPGHCSVRGCAGICAWGLFPQHGVGLKRPPVPLSLPGCFPAFGMTLLGMGQRW